MALLLSRILVELPVAATSSYITIPPPYTHVYSVGGPTGESHVIDPETGGFRDKVQELLFVPEDELGSADKTRVALVRRVFSIGNIISPEIQLAEIRVPWN